jgi:hypothetical protein
MPVLRVHRQNLPVFCAFEHLLPLFFQKLLKKTQHLPIAVAFAKLEVFFLILALSLLIHSHNNNKPYKTR